MKAVLISIQPKWVEKIANGKKTLEIRKSRPKLETPFKVYIYCTYGNPKDNYCLGKRGKVIGEFVCDRIEDFSKWEFDYSSLLIHINLDAGTNSDYKFLIDYLKGQKQGYGWHISDLVIYDKPKWLREFKITGCKGCKDKDTYHCKFHCFGERKITRPPQSWCYVEKGE